MKRNVVLTSAAIVLLSTAAAFATCNGKAHQQAMSCADGTIYDAETRTCVPIVNS